MSRPFGAVAALALLCSAGAWATTLLAVDVPALVRSSDVIVRGKVVRTSCRWTSDHLRIITEVEVGVEEAWKGAPGKTLTVVQPGGVVGDIGQKVSGVASFTEGEEVVLFLEKRPGPTFLVSGLSQGKFRVERSSDGRTAWAVPEGVGDALLVDPSTGQPTTPPPSTPPTLEQLRSQVRSSLEQAPSSPAPTPVLPKKVP